MQPKQIVPADLMRDYLASQASRAPDLVVEGSPEAVDYSVDTMVIPPNSCSIEEGCGIEGVRRLLRYNVKINNIGNADLIIGNPMHDTNRTMFIYSECHGHYHWPAMVTVKLMNAQGEQVAASKKIGFCMLDFMPYTFPPLPFGRDRYDCVHQGLSEGWSDLYHKNLDCQWIDITGIPSGAYTLHMEVNAARMVRELRYDNNVAVVPVVIEDHDTAIPPPPANDRCAGAQTLELGIPVTVATRGATSNGLACGGVAEAGASVWYKVRGNGKRLLVSTCNPETTIDTTVTVYRECDPNTPCNEQQLTCVSGLDDGWCGALAYVHWCSEPDVWYYVAVGGDQTSTGTIQLLALAIGDEFMSLYWSTEAKPDDTCSGPFILADPAVCPAAMNQAARRGAASSQAGVALLGGVEPMQYQEIPASGYYAPPQQVQSMPWQQGEL